MSTTTTDPNSKAADWLPIVRKQVDSLRFGIVVITVHNGEVVQIERTEKTRIDKKSDGQKT